MDYDKFLTATSKRRAPSQLRQMAKHYLHLTEKYYPLCGGLPSPEIFNFTESTFKMKDGSQIHLDAELMNIAQQYGVSEGYQKLLDILRDFQTRLHAPPMKNWTITITNGAQDCICKSMEMILNEGDFIIGGDHCYTGTLEIIRGIGAKYLEVEQDHLGLRPESLRTILQQWDVQTCRNNKKISPKCIYMVPNGGNPEGRTISTERRKEIYKIAQEYDLLIIEDDPYQFIVFDNELPPSFLSLDVDGRVIRCDSFSKTIAPGFRLGYLTAAEPLVQRVVYHIQVSSQQPNCLSQAVVYQLLMKWGFEGYIKNAKLACGVFKKNKNLAVKYAQKWLSDVAEWDDPSGGMFMWIKIKGVEDSMPIHKKAMEKKVFFAPGAYFKFYKTLSPYLRVSFSQATEEQLDNSFRILAEIVREEQCIRSGHA